MSSSSSLGGVGGVSSQITTPPTSSGNGHMSSGNCATVRVNYGFIDVEHRYGLAQVGLNLIINSVVPDSCFFPHHHIGGKHVQENIFFSFTYGIKCAKVIYNAAYVLFSASLCVTFVLCLHSNLFHSNDLLNWG